MTDVRIHDMSKMRLPFVINPTAEKINRQRLSTHFYPTVLTETSYGAIQLNLKQLNEHILALDPLPAALGPYVAFINKARKEAAAMPKAEGSAASSSAAEGSAASSSAASGTSAAEPDVAVKMEPADSTLLYFFKNRTLTTEDIVYLYLPTAHDNGERFPSNFERAERLVLIAKKAFVELYELNIAEGTTLQNTPLQEFIQQAIKEKKHPINTDTFAHIQNLVDKVGTYFVSMEASMASMALNTDAIQLAPKPEAKTRSNSVFNIASAAVSAAAAAVSTPKKDEAEQEAEKKTSRETVEREITQSKFTLLNISALHALRSHLAHMTDMLDILTQDKSHTAGKGKLEAQLEHAQARIVELTGNEQTAGSIEQMDAVIKIDDHRKKTGNADPLSVEERSQVTTELAHKKDQRAAEQNRVQYIRQDLATAEKYRAQAKAYLGYTEQNQPTSEEDYIAHLNMALRGLDKYFEHYTATNPFSLRDNKTLQSAHLQPSFRELDALDANDLLAADAVIKILMSTNSVTLDRRLIDILEQALRGGSTQAQDDQPILRAQMQLDNINALIQKLLNNNSRMNVDPSKIEKRKVEKPADVTMLRNASYFSEEQNETNRKYDADLKAADEEHALAVKETTAAKKADFKKQLRSLFESKFNLIISALIENVKYHGANDVAGLIHMLKEQLECDLSLQPENEGLIQKAAKPKRLDTPKYPLSLLDKKHLYTKLLADIAKNFTSTANKLAPALTAEQISGFLAHIANNTELANEMGPETFLYFLTALHKHKLVHSSDFIIALMEIMKPIDKSKAAHYPEWKALSDKMHWLAALSLNPIGLNYVAEKLGEFGLEGIWQVRSLSNSVAEGSNFESAPDLPEILGRLSNAVTALNQNKSNKPMAELTISEQMNIRDKEKAVFIEIKTLYTALYQIANYRSAPLLKDPDNNSSFPEMYARHLQQLIQFAKALLPDHAQFLDQFVSATQKNWSSMNTKMNSYVADKQGKQAEAEGQKAEAAQMEKLQAAMTGNVRKAVAANRAATRWLGRAPGSARPTIESAAVLTPAPVAADPTAASNAGAGSSAPTMAPPPVPSAEEARTVSGLFSAAPELMTPTGGAAEASDRDWSMQHQAGSPAEEEVNANGIGGPGAEIGAAAWSTSSAHNSGPVQHYQEDAHSTHNSSAGGGAVTHDHAEEATDPFYAAYQSADPGVTLRRTPQEHSPEISSPGGSSQDNRSLIFAALVQEQQRRQPQQASMSAAVSASPAASPAVGSAKNTPGQGGRPGVASRQRQSTRKLTAGIDVATTPAQGRRGPGPRLGINSTALRGAGTLAPVHAGEADAAQGPLQANTGSIAAAAAARRQYLASSVRVEEDQKYTSDDEVKQQDDAAGGTMTPAAMRVLAAGLGTVRGTTHQNAADTAARQQAQGPRSTYST
jgi:AraC-like DNA-binding protein